ncbi:hypothetical protein MMD27_004369 [Acinetobacter baumannii]|nr:hypothetical protein [Acinetobacter baumannii]EKU3445980.1 hypothetical protein [Acinetobacter baumannii]
METLSLFIYSHTFATILVSIAVGFVIAVLIVRFTKVKSLFPTVFTFSILTYGAILFSPIPPPVERQIIQMLDLMEHNKVDSNGTINAVLFPCMSKDFNGVRGMQVQEIREAFRSEVDEQVKKVGSFSGGETALKLKTDDLCEAAWQYNAVKIKRLNSDS